MCSVEIFTSAFHILKHVKQVVFDKPTLSLVHLQQPLNREGATRPYFGIVPHMVILELLQSIDHNIEQNPLADLRAIILRWDLRR